MDIEQGYKIIVYMFDLWVTDSCLKQFHMNEISAQTVLKISQALRRGKNGQRIFGIDCHMKDLVLLDVPHSSLILHAQTWL